MVLVSSFCERPAAVGGTGVHAAVAGAADMEGSAMFSLDVDHDALASGTVLFVVYIRMVLVSTYWERPDGFSRYG